MKILQEILKVHTTKWECRLGSCGLEIAQDGRQSRKQQTNFKFHFKNWKFLEHLMDLSQAQQGFYSMRQLGYLKLFHIAAVDRLMLFDIKVYI